MATANSAAWTSKRNRMAITRVQSITTSTAAGAAAATLQLTLAATTSGNVVMVAVNATSAATIKVTSLHGIFTDVTPQGMNTSATNAVHIFMGIMSGADTTITVGAFGNARMVAVAAEYSGVHITPSDIPINIQSNTATPNTGAITNSVANSLYVAALGQKGFNSSTTNSNFCNTPTNSFNIVNQNTTSVNSGAVDLALIYLDSIVTTSSARNTSVVSALGTIQASGLLATFIELASGGGGLRLAGHGGLAS